MEIIGLLFLLFVVIMFYVSNIPKSYSDNKKFWEQDHKFMLDQQKKFLDKGN